MTSITPVGEDEEYQELDIRAMKKIIKILRTKYGTHDYRRQMNLLNLVMMKLIYDMMQYLYRQNFTDPKYIAHYKEGFMTVFEEMLFQGKIILDNYDPANEDPSLEKIQKAIWEIHDKVKSKYKDLYEK